MRIFYLCVCNSIFLLLSLQSYAQQPSGGGFGGFFANELPREQPVSKERLEVLSKTLQKTISGLRSRGIIKGSRVAADTVKFGWPLRQAIGYNDPGYYGISNYIDQDPRKDTVLEYNCGKRTYDGHRGTDIFTYPFGWNKMDENAVEIIAAADGIIVAKYDGNPDTSCANCDPNAADCQWNAVFVKSNIDGTIAWYGHMKKNSQTAKLVGASVTKGEYLGVVGSAGNSTGPHLHFEVWLNEDYNFLVDPWEGTCNSDHNSSFWEKQQAYYMPGIIKVSTASGVPQFSQCYAGGQGEQPKYKDVFTLNETVYLPVYIRDNLAGKQYDLKIITPSGAVKYSWSIATFNAYYSSAWFYYFYPATTTFNEIGTWKYSVKYDTSYAEHSFEITQPLPLNLLSFSGENNGKVAQLQWKTSGEDNVNRYVVERSPEGAQFQPIGSVKSKGSASNPGLNNYQYTDALPANGNNYYRLKMFDNDGKSSLSNVIKLNVKATGEEMVLLSNPVGTTLRFVSSGDYKNAFLKVIDYMGKTVVLKNHFAILSNQQTSFDVSSLAAGSYYMIIEQEHRRIVKKFVKK